jgi:glycosyltransferase involved in cell wall biosynthesis
LKILIITIEPPLPFSSAAAKWFFVLVNDLIARGHQVCCFSVCSKPNDMIEARKYFPDKNILRLYPFSTKKKGLDRVSSVLKPYSYMFSENFVSDLKLELKKSYDVIHVEQLWAGWVIPKEYLSRSIINIHHYVMIDLEKTQKTKTNLLYEYFQTMRAEKLLTKKFSYHRFFTDRLLQRSKKFMRLAQGDSQVIPFSLDAKLYTERISEPQELSIGMIASMGWYPGKSAALTLIDQIFPSLHSETPALKLRIAGWGARKELASFLEQDGIEILENIPVVEDFFKSLSVFVYIPSRGSGMKIKVLEAMMFGLPVVTNQEGLEGLPAVHGEQVMIAHSVSEAITHTKTLLNSPSMRQKIGHAGRKLVEDHCDRSCVINSLEKMYEKIISNNGVV